MQKAVPQGAKTSDDPSRTSQTQSRSTQQPAQGLGYIAQMAAMANSSPRAQLQRQLAAQIEGSSQITAQRKLAAEVNAGSHDAAQTKKKEELRQHKVANGAAQLAAAPAPNKTGLPDNLKAGVESLSGVSLASVKVHYNSHKPAQLNALAYAQGTDIHVAPGQEKHLPHEAWHITQQSQGRVKPTTQAKGVAINDDSHLEKEADVMGAKAATAVQKKSSEGSSANSNPSSGVLQLKTFTSSKVKGFTVDTESGSGGTFAQASQDDKPYKKSSIEYSMFRYMNALDPPNTVKTNVQMATQTDTMHAYPERQGVGTLLAAQAVEHLEANGIKYFQPDILKSSGGNAMTAMIVGEKRGSDVMESLISEADGRQIAESESCGCWESLKKCFGCGSPELESRSLLQKSGVKTYPAIEVDIEKTKTALEAEVGKRFNEKFFET